MDQMNRSERAVVLLSMLGSLNVSAGEVRVVKVNAFAHARVNTVGKVLIEQNGATTEFAFDAKRGPTPCFHRTLEGFKELEWTVGTRDAIKAEACKAAVFKYYDNYDCRSSRSIDFSGERTPGGQVMQVNLVPTDVQVVLNTRNEETGRPVVEPIRCD